MGKTNRKSKENKDVKNQLREENRAQEVSKKEAEEAEERDIQAALWYPRRKTRQGDVMSVLLDHTMEERDNFTDILDREVYGEDNGDDEHALSTEGAQALVSIFLDKENWPLMVEDGEEFFSSQGVSWDAEDLLSTCTYWMDAKTFGVLARAVFVIDAFNPSYEWAEQLIELVIRRSLGLQASEIVRELGLFSASHDFPMDAQRNVLETMGNQVSRSSACQEKMRAFLAHVFSEEELLWHDDDYYGWVMSTIIGHNAVRIIVATNTVLLDAIVYAHGAGHVDTDHIGDIDRFLYSLGRGTAQPLFFLEKYEFHPALAKHDLLKEKRRHFSADSQLILVERAVKRHLRAKDYVNARISLQALVVVRGDLQRKAFDVAAAHRFFYLRSLLQVNAGDLMGALRDLETILQTSDEYGPVYIKALRARRVINGKLGRTRYAEHDAVLLKVLEDAEKEVEEEANKRNVHERTWPIGHGNLTSASSSVSSISPSLSSPTTSTSSSPVLPLSSSSSAQLSNLQPPQVLRAHFLPANRPSAPFHAPTLRCALVVTDQKIVVLDVVTGVVTTSVTFSKAPNELLGHIAVDWESGILVVSFNQVLWHFPLAWGAEPTGGWSSTSESLRKPVHHVVHCFCHETTCGVNNEYRFQGQCVNGRSRVSHSQLAAGFGFIATNTSISSPGKNSRIELVVWRSTGKHYLSLFLNSYGVVQRMGIAGTAKRPLLWASLPSWMDSGPAALCWDLNTGEPLHFLVPTFGTDVFGRFVMTLQTQPSGPVLVGSQASSRHLAVFDGDSGRLLTRWTAPEEWGPIVKTAIIGNVIALVQKINCHLTLLRLVPISADVGTENACDLPYHTATLHSLDALEGNDANTLLMCVGLPNGEKTHLDLELVIGSEQGSARMFIFGGLVAEADAPRELRSVRCRPEKEAGWACNFCHTTTARVFKCARCQERWYCSQICQRTDWSQHKPHCKKKV